MDKTFFIPLGRSTASSCIGKPFNRHANTCQKNACLKGQSMVIVQPMIYYIAVHSIKSFKNKF